VNGGGQAGLTSDQIIAGAAALYDGSLMDVLKFTGDTAVTDAQKYKCQNGSSQTPHVFACDPSGKITTCQYVTCLTQNIDVVAVVTNGNALDTNVIASVSPAYEEKMTTFRNECWRAADQLPDAGNHIPKYSSNYNHSGSAIKKIACTPADSSAPNQSCYQAYATCAPDVK
jgi:hypothetical protein